MIINIIGDLNEDMQEMFVKELNEVLTVRPPWVDIYIDSRGGSVTVGEAITEMISEVAKEMPVRVIASGELMSAAFSLFFAVKCEKKVLQSAIGMAHRGRLNGYIYDGGVRNYEEEEKVKFSKYLGKKNEQIIRKIGFRSSELEKYLKGEDVYFLPKRLKQLLKKDKNRKVYGKDFKS